MIRDHIRIVREIARGVAKTVPDARYLELGVFKARCLNRVAPMFKEAVAVDANDREMYIKVPCVFHHSTTDDYFDGIYDGRKFDLIFIDANHDFNFAMRDFKNAYDAINDNGLILMHDTYPPSKRHFHGCQNAYLVPAWIKEQMLDGEFVTLPFYYGITIFRKCKKQLLWL